MNVSISFCSDDIIMSLFIIIIKTPFDSCKYTAVKEKSVAHAWTQTLAFLSSREQGPWLEAGDPVL